MHLTPAEAMLLELMRGAAMSGRPLALTLRIRAGRCRIRLAAPGVGAGAGEGESFAAAWGAIAQLSERRQ